jgi:hypothetical protein
MLRRPVNVGTRVERTDQGQGTTVPTEIGPRWWNEGQLLGAFCLSELQRRAREQTVEMDQPTRYVK